MKLKSKQLSLFPRIQRTSFVVLSIFPLCSFFIKDKVINHVTYDQNMRLVSFEVYYTRRAHLKSVRQRLIKLLLTSIYVATYLVCEIFAHGTFTHGGFG